MFESQIPFCGRRRPRFAGVLEIARSAAAAGLLGVALAGAGTEAAAAEEAIASAATAGEASTRKQAAGPGPLRLHPGNPRYLTDDSGRAIVLAGSHTWSIFQDLEHRGKRHRPRYGSYRAWLNLLGRWNHTFSRGWLWEDGYYSPLPWARSGGLYDLEKIDPAFLARLSARVRRAEERGIYLGILLFQGWSVTARDADASASRLPDPWPRHPFATAKNRNRLSADSNGDGRGLEVHRASGRVLELQKTYVARLVEALSPFDNIVWEIANEANAESLDWQLEIAAWIRHLESRLGRRHLVWMSCFGGGNDDRNDALFSAPADIVSPCAGPDAPYLENPPAARGRVVLADSDHIAPRRVNRLWVWRSFLRGLHPVYMDLAADSLPWYQGPSLVQDPRIAEQIRRSLGAVVSLADSLPLARMAPQGSDAEAPLVHLGGQPPFALFSTAQPAAERPRFDGAELLALEQQGGETLEICGLTPGAGYVVRWLRTVDASGVDLPRRFKVAVPAADPGTAADGGSVADDAVTPDDPGAPDGAEAPGSALACRRFTNPDAGGDKLLHLRRLEVRTPGGPEAPAAVE